MSKVTRVGWAGASLLGFLLVVAIACEDSGVIPPSGVSNTWRKACVSSVTARPSPSTTQPATRSPSSVATSAR